MTRVTIGGRSYEVEVRGDTVVVDGKEFPVTVRNEGAHLAVNAGGVAYRVQLPPNDGRGPGMQVQVDYRPFTLEYEGRLGGGPPPRPSGSAPPRSAVPAAGAVKGAVRAQIAGRVLSVRVQPGQAVSAGDVLLILEAMKMENEIKSPSDGIVKEVLVADGARVNEGETLVVVE